MNMAYRYLILKTGSLHIVFKMQVFRFVFLQVTLLLVFYEQFSFFHFSNKQFIFSHAAQFGGSAAVVNLSLDCYSCFFTKIWMNGRCLQRNQLCFPLFRPSQITNQWRAVSLEIPAILAESRGKRKGEMKGLDAGAVDDCIGALRCAYNAHIAQYGYSKRSNPSATCCVAVHFSLSIQAFSFGFCSNFR